MARNTKVGDDFGSGWDELTGILSYKEGLTERNNDGEINTMNYFLKKKEIDRIISQWLHQMAMTYSRQRSEDDTSTKSDEVSLLWRQRGNEKFRVSQFENSYRCYSKSVMYAPQDGPMFPLALANRSAALLKLKRFEECLSDIALAIERQYPYEQQHKLLLRRADCHIELFDVPEANIAIEEAKRHAAALKLSASHANEFERNLKILEQKVFGINRTPNFNPIVLPEVYLGENRDFASASNAIEVSRSESAGRQVTVTKPVKRGDVMFSEQPYAWVKLPTDEFVCGHCCASNINALPCSVCSRAMYCDMKCRSEAEQSFHHWECVGGRMELFPTIGIAHLALRVLLVGAENGFPEVPHTDGHTNTAAGLFNNYEKVDTKQIYSTDKPDFYRMFNLVTNFDKMNNTDYIQYALTATMLVKYLEEYTSFFEYLPSRLLYSLSSAELRLFAGALILRALGQLVCNGHATLSLATDVEEGPNNSHTVGEREVRRATAIYPSAAMMNHSCDPNIITLFYKNRIIVVCARELSPGTELLNCYGPHRSREPTADRRAQLRAQYMFNCMCEACVDPLKGDFVLLFSAYACRSCKGPLLKSNLRHQCPQCHAEFSLERALATIDTADELFAEAERATLPEERCEKALKSLRLRQQAWHRHHTQLRAAADEVARIYAEAGDYAKSVELIKQNIQSLEYQFGSFSVEVAHELRKMADVLVERIVRNPDTPEMTDWCMEALKILKKAVQLMELNYGCWEDMVRHLKKQRAFVSGLIGEELDQDEGAHRPVHYNLKI